MITFNASADYGLSGQYVARITGRHASFTFERTFLGRKGGKRNESTSADVDDPGLYEECDVRKKHGKSSTYYACVVRLKPDGTTGLLAVPIKKAEAMQLAKLLDQRFDWSALARSDDGETVVLTLSPGAAKAAAADATVGEAVTACWAAIAVLPTKEQKKVIAELRARISPPAQTSDARGPDVDGQGEP